MPTCAATAFNADDYSGSFSGSTALIRKSKCDNGSFGSASDGCQPTGARRRPRTGSGNKRRSQKNRDGLQDSQRCTRTGCSYAAGSTRPSRASTTGHPDEARLRAIGSLILGILSENKIICFSRLSLRTAVVFLVPSDSFHPAFRETEKLLC